MKQLTKKFSIFAICVSLLTIAFEPVSVYAKDTDTCISDEAYEACLEYGEEYDICPELLMAIIEKESCGEPDAQNGNCKGLMQINVTYHEQRMKDLGVTDIWDEEQNIHVGADILDELFEKYEDVYLVLMAYNMGERKAIKCYDKGVFTKYSTSICERAKELEGGK